MRQQPTPQFPEGECYCSMPTRTNAKETMTGIRRAAIGITPANSRKRFKERRAAGRVLSHKIESALGRYADETSKPNSREMYLRIVMTGREAAAIQLPSTDRREIR